MGRFILLTIILNFVSFVVIAQQKVEFISTYTSSYCNGCAPSDKEIKEISTPTPFNTKLYLYALDNQRNMLMIVDSNKITELEYGNYLLSFSELSQEQFEKNKNLKDIFTNEILTQEEANISLVTITNNTKKINVNYNYYCSWELNPMEEIPPIPNK